MIGYVIYPQHFECFLIRELIEKLNSDLIMFTFVWGFRSVLFFRDQQRVFLRRGSPVFEKIMTVAEGIEAPSADFWKIEIVIGGIVTHRLWKIETPGHEKARQQSCSYTLCVIKIYTFHKLKFLSKHQTIFKLSIPPQTFKPFSI